MDRYNLKYKYRYITPPWHNYILVMFVLNRVAKSSGCEHLEAVVQLDGFIDIILLLLLLLLLFDRPARFIRLVQNLDHRS